MMKHEVTSLRLKEALNQCNMIPKELSLKSGVSEASISQYVNGNHAPSNISSGKMASVLGVDPMWLMGFDVPMRKNDGKVSSTRTINVLGRVAAGIPINAVEEIIDTEEITEEMAKTGEYFGLRISGHSMEPRICNGDVVIVRQQSDVDDGDIAIVLVNGSDGTCKRIKRYQDSLALLPLNPSYEPMIYSKDEVDSLPVKIIGKVVELRGKF